MTVFQIAASADDAYMDNATPRSDFSHIYIVTTSGPSAWRWALTGIPAGSTILSAIFSFFSRSAEDGGDTNRWQIFDQDNCDDFDVDFSAWALMAGFYDQVMPVVANDTWISLDDIKTIVQAFIDRPGYVMGNYLGLRAARTDGWDIQEADTWDSEVAHDTGAKLTITFTPPPPVTSRKICGKLVTGF